MEGIKLIRQHAFVALIALSSACTTPTRLYVDPALREQERAEILFRVDGLAADKLLLIRQRAWVEVDDVCAPFWTSVRGFFYPPTEGSVVVSSVDNPKTFVVPADRPAKLRVVFSRDGLLGGGACKRAFGFDPEPGGKYELEFFVNRRLGAESLCSADLTDAQTGARPALRYVDDLACDR